MIVFSQYVVSTAKLFCSAVVALLLGNVEIWNGQFSAPDYIYQSTSFGESTNVGAAIPRSGAICLSIASSSCLTTFHRYAIPTTYEKEGFPLCVAWMSGNIAEVVNFSPTS